MRQPHSCSEDGHFHSQVIIRLLPWDRVGRIGGAGKAERPITHLEVRVEARQRTTHPGTGYQARSARNNAEGWDPKERSERAPGEGLTN